MLNASQVTPVVEYILDTYQKEFDTARRDRWRQTIVDKAGVSDGTARSILSGSPGTRIADESLRSLAAWFGQIPAFKGMNEHWFLSVADLKNRIGNGPGAQVSHTGGRGSVTIEAPLPKLWDTIVRDLHGNWILYRYAFEDESKRVAREVVTFTNTADTQQLGYINTYRMTRLTADKDDDEVMQLAGHVMPVGLSLFSVASHLPDGDPLASMNRVRCLFMRHGLDQFENLARIGIVSTTKADGTQEPVAACALLIKVSADLPDANAVTAFRDKITILRDIGEFLEHDFGITQDNGHKQFVERRLSNAPEQGDHVLKIHHHGFGRAAQALIAQSPANAPWTKNWRSATLLAKK